MIHTQVLSPLDFLTLTAANNRREINKQQRTLKEDE